MLGDALKALDALNEGNWKKQREVAAGLVGQAKEWIDGHILREVREEGCRP